MKSSFGWRMLGVLSAALLATVCAGRVQAQLYQAPYGPNGTWNLYERGDVTLTWAEALDEARSRTQKNVTGDLASIHSMEENAAVQFIGGGADVLIGATDREGAAPQLLQNGAMSPQESIELEGKGCCNDDFAKLQGWAWTTGEPFTFHNWNGGEPNNWDGAGPAAADVGYEDIGIIWGDGTWNDAASGYAEDEPIPAVLQPGSSTDESGGRAGAFNFVIEYRTQAASPYADIPIFEVPKLMPAAIQSYPAGGDGYLAVTDLKPAVTVTQPAISVSQQITQIANGDLDADIYSKQVPISDVADPGSEGAGTINPTVNLTPLSDAVGGASEDFIEVWRGNIKVDEPGTYTFQFHTDDGFVAKIPGRTWTASQGNGTTDGQHVYHNNNTGDSNTFATVDLPAGVHEFQMYWWERGGGAFGEVTTAKGDFINGAGDKRGQYLALGDTRELPEQTVFPEAGLGRLNGPLVIHTINGISPGDGIEALRLDVLDRIAEGTTDAMSDDGEVFVIDDDRINPGGCPFGAFPHDGNVVQWPNTAGDVNNFAAGIFGSFRIDNGNGTPGETYEVTVHVDSDDRSIFRIIGQDFSDVDAQSLFDIDGDDSMFADVDTCNTNYSGLITLTEGVDYDFEGFLVENGGDAGMQVLFAEGDLLFDRDPSNFEPLAVLNAQGITLARNIGLRLVAPGVAVPGDFNGNGVLDSGDIDDLTMQSAGGQNPAAYDLNADNLVNGDDVNAWISDLYKSYPGDLNLDKEFSSADLVDMLAAGLYETGQPSKWSTGDFNGDGITNSGDLVTALAGGGYEQGPKQAVAASVPEPSSLLLVLLGTLAAISSRRRRTK